MKKTVLTAALIILAGSILFTGCLKKSGGLTIKPGVLMVGMEIGYPPMEYYDADGKTNFDTAHAAFNILAKDSTVKYGESFCVFGQITKLPDGTTIHQSSLYPQLWTNYSYDSAYSNTNRIKYMFRIEMDNPSVNYGNPLRVKV